MAGSTNECDNVPSRPTFINKLPECSWIHCSHDGWKCPDNNVDCYHIEHIIPKNNSIPELTGCNTNIYGNVIMAYGLWNAQLGNKFLPEKYLIYGDVFINAYNSVYKCCHSGTSPIYNPIVNECPIKRIEYWIMFLIICVVAFISLIIGAILKWLNRDITIVVYDYDESNMSVDASDTSDTDTSL
jgi:hypothetical protein